jgi:hypothetical protein
MTDGERENEKGVRHTYLVTLTDAMKASLNPKLGRCTTERFMAKDRKCLALAEDHIEEQHFYVQHRETNSLAWMYKAGVSTACNADKYLLKSC